MSSEQAPDVRPFIVVFRPDLFHQIGYYATVETIAQLASDFAGDDATGGVYQVFMLAESDPRTLALRFEDVLYIG